MSSGKLLALTIGCSYKSTRYQLNGTINDAQNMSNLLSSIGYSVTFMNDNIPANSSLYPTMNNILEQIRLILTTSQPGDDVVVFYAGHGVQVLSNSLKDYSDGVVESDGKDEALVPVDFQSKGSSFTNVIVDDTLNTWLRNFSKEGVRILIICDCCHSGTVCDLKYVYSYGGKITGSLSDSISKNDIFFDQQSDSPLDNTKPIKATVITLSASRDEQVAWEDVPSFDKGGRKQGLLTSALIHTITTNKSSARDIFLILRNVQQYTASYKQNPKVSSNVPLHLAQNDNNRYILYGSSYGNQTNTQSSNQSASAVVSVIPGVSKPVTASVSGSGSGSAVAQPVKANQQLPKSNKPVQTVVQSVKPYVPHKPKASGSIATGSSVIMGSSMNSIYHYSSPVKPDVVKPITHTPVSISGISQHHLTQFLV